VAGDGQCQTRRTTPALGGAHEPLEFRPGGELLRYGLVDGPLEFRLRQELREIEEGTGG
jgi:hypothetical protein